MDSFSGSGSTLIACERSGRRFRGVELDPLYVDLAVRRWEAETGLKAQLEGSDLTLEALPQARCPNRQPDDPPPRPRGRVPAGSSRGRA